MLKGTTKAILILLVYTPVVISKSTSSRLSITPLSLEHTQSSQEKIL